MQFHSGWGNKKEPLKRATIRVNFQTDLNTTGKVHEAKVQILTRFEIIREILIGAFKYFLAPNRSKGIFNDLILMGANWTIRRFGLGLNFSRGYSAYDCGDDMCTVRGHAPY